MQDHEPEDHDEESDEGRSEDIAERMLRAVLSGDMHREASRRAGHAQTSRALGRFMHR